MVPGSPCTPEEIRPLLVQGSPGAPEEIRPVFVPGSPGTPEEIRPLLVQSSHQGEFGLLSVYFAYPLYLSVRD